MIGDGSGTAVDALSAAVSVQPGRGDLWGELATALVAAGRAQEAWDAAVRAVELEPRSAASHRAIGTVAEALGDSTQAESAYRQASLLGPASSAAPNAEAVGGGRHASDRAPALAAWMAGQIAAPEPRPPADSDAASPANGSRHAAPEYPPGRHGVPDPPAGRRLPDTGSAEPAAPERPLTTQPSTGGRRRAPEVDRATAVGLPGWLGPVGPTPDPHEWARAVPASPTRVADPVAWRRGLIAVVRIEWLVGVVCFLGLAYARTAPYTAGLLAGALVVAGAYGRLRWKATTARRAPEQDRVPTYATVAAVATAVVIIPAAMAGALTLARVAAVAAVTSATVAAVLLARPVGKDIWP